MNTKATCGWWLLVAVLSGCGADFSPPSLLSDLRVLALIADPVEAGPQDEVHLWPALYVPPAATVIQKRLSFCPLSLGASAGFRCAVPACERELQQEADGSARIRPGQAAVDCWAAQGGGGQLPTSLPQEIPEEIEVLYRLQVVAQDGQAREAVLRQKLWTQGPAPALNRNPVIASVSIAGAELSPGGTAAAIRPGAEIEVRVHVDPESLDDFVDESGRSRREDAVVSFLATAGRFDFDQGSGPEVTVTWTADEQPASRDPVEMFFVLRDLRGGQAVSGPYLIPYAP